MYPGLPILTYRQLKQLIQTSYNPSVSVPMSSVIEQKIKLFQNLLALTLG
jgi:hypothetical protein